MVGEHIRALRGGLWSHAIDCGDETVIHLASDDAAFRAVRRSYRPDFVQGAEMVEVVTHRERTFPANEVVARAYSRISDPGLAAMFRDSEAFADWCVTGRLGAIPQNAAAAVPAPAPEAVPAAEPAPEARAPAAAKAKAKAKAALARPKAPAKAKPAAARKAPARAKPARASAAKAPRRAPSASKKKATRKPAGKGARPAAKPARRGGTRARSR